MKKVCFGACIALGTVFLVMAICGAWKYLFTTGVCYATAVLVSEDKASKNKS
ncbi:MAG: hypothetical protein K2H95_07890 [Bacteroidales bacterium]|nr:hypothetical protein [Bacteroidales bacterium]MDE6147325.1 hypothetical protein [Bacteroidales bacterium]